MDFVELLNALLDLSTIHFAHFSEMSFLCAQLLFCPRMLLYPVSGVKLSIRTFCFIPINSHMYNQGFLVGY